MAKNVSFKNEGMIKGLDKINQAVASTIGPKGRNVYIKDDEIPRITNDGVSISGHIYLEDEEEDAGAYIIRNVCGQQLDDCGDGTTTVAVLTHAIIHECLKRPENVMEIKESLNKAGQSILKKLAKTSIQTKKEDIEKIAFISAEDKKIARSITEIVNKLGEGVVINVEDSKTFATEYEVIEGYEAQVGYMSPKFADKTGKVTFENIPVLVTENKISTLTDIMAISEVFQKEKIGMCVFVCADVDDSMLGVFITSNSAGTIKNVVIRATDWLLKDIEGLTGARAISASNGLTFQNFSKEDLGFAKKIISSPNTTLFITDGVASKKYSKYLEMQAENDPNMFSAKQTMKRVDKLNGKVAVLKIGAATDTERGYLKDKAEDSVKAVQAALAEGYVEGGGMALWRLAQTLEGKTIGEAILKKALTAPLRQIIENCGKDYTEVLMNISAFKKNLDEDNRGRHPEENLGYDAKNDTYCVLIQNGIIDPTKVERLCIENAISAASTFITTSALITNVHEEK